MSMPKTKLCVSIPSYVVCIVHVYLVPDIRQCSQCIEVSPILCPFSTQSIHSYVMKCHLNSLSMLMPGLSLDVSATHGRHYKCQTKSKAAKSPFVQFKTHSVSQRRVKTGRPFTELLPLCCCDLQNTTLQVCSQQLCRF